ncbi:MAG: glycosyltransferase [Planctomycetota bacterium]|nr:glycosyltransferase [Planctomycetota bacterium]
MAILAPEQITDKHTREFLVRQGDVCAARRCNLRQLLCYFVLVPGALLLCFLRDYKVAFTVLTFTLCGCYGVVIFFRLASVLLAMIRSSEQRVTREELQALDEKSLPVFTVLVPMYKEPEVAQKIARTVTHLDYPVEKLDVKLLLEEDDLATRAKINEVLESLPHCVEVIVAPSVPKGEPRTKPRACNWGLEKARGEYLVIFDAEDQPDRDQLKKAIVVFRRLDAQGKKSVTCLQAKLNYFNAHQNTLTRFFTLEYTNWFDLFLPGLHAVGTPIPLGGTSNHFRTAPLKTLGGWDSFNVTEDCDLGIRMARNGYSTEVLDSTTWEEANSQVGNWIRQRSRWIKGYFQTHLVHTRDAVLPGLILAGIYAALWRVFDEDLRGGGLPEDLQRWIVWFKAACVVLGALSVGSSVLSIAQRFRRQAPGSPRQLGLWHALTFRFTVGGLSLMLLLNMVFWLMTGAYLLREPLANVLPNAILNRKLDETTTVRDALRGWKLYYTNVVDEERFANVTFWNSVRGFLRHQLDWNQLRDNVAAIDSWSLVSQLFYPIAIMLFIANFVFVLLGLLSCHKRGLWDLFPYALLVPFYWILISIAAFKGFEQLFTNPFYWEKTQHGLSPQQPTDRPPDPQQKPPATMESVTTAAGGGA